MIICELYFNDVEYDEVEVNSYNTNKTSDMILVINISPYHSIKIRKLKQYCHTLLDAEVIDDVQSVCKEYEIYYLDDMIAYSFYKHHQTKSDIITFIKKLQELDCFVDLYVCDPSETEQEIIYYNGLPMRKVNPRKHYRIDPNSDFIHSDKCVKLYKSICGLTESYVINENYFDDVEQEEITVDDEGSSDTGTMYLIFETKNNNATNIIKKLLDFFMNGSLVDVIDDAFKDDYGLTVKGLTFSFTPRKQSVKNVVSFICKLSSLAHSLYWGDLDIYLYDKEEKEMVVSIEMSSVIYYDETVINLIKPFCEQLCDRVISNEMFLKNPYSEFNTILQCYDNGKYNYDISKEYCIRITNDFLQHQYWTDKEYRNSLRYSIDNKYTVYLNKVDVNTMKTNAKEKTIGNKALFNPKNTKLLEFLLNTPCLKYYDLYDSFGQWNSDNYSGLLTFVPKRLYYDGKNYYTIYIGIFFDTYRMAKIWYDKFKSSLIFRKEEKTR